MSLNLRWCPTNMAWVLRWGRAVIATYPPGSREEAREAMALLRGRVWKPSPSPSA